jgi:hypothetical protein
MRYPFNSVIFLILISSSCASGQKQKLNTVFERKDLSGNIIERWGNEKKKDDDVNFRFYFFFDKQNVLIREKQYFFEPANVKCEIIDTADYDEILYKYAYINNKYIKATETKYIPKLDINNKVIGRALYYKLDLINNKKHYSSTDSMLMQ